MKTTDAEHCPVIKRLTDMQRDVVFQILWLVLFIFLLI